MDYGYTRMTIHNKTHLYMEQVSVDKVSEGGGVRCGVVGKGIGCSNFIPLARVVEKVDNAIHQINHYPLEYSMVC